MTDGVERRASTRLTHDQIAHGREQGTHARLDWLANYLAD
jgi:hypothetical protein